MMKKIISWGLMAASLIIIGASIYYVTVLLVYRTLP